MQDQSNNPVTKQPNLTWPISLAVICIGIISYGYFYSSNTINDIAYLVGYNLIIATIIWGIFYVAISRTQSKIKNSLAFLLILISLTLGSLTAAHQHKQTRVSAISEIQKNYQQIINESIDAQGMPQQIKQQLDTTTKAQGEFGEMEKFMKNIMNKMASQHNAYLLELDAIKWDKILDPDRIKTDSTLSQSKAMIQNAKNIAKKYRARTNSVLESAKSDIFNLNLSMSSKEELLHGFEIGVNESRGQFDKMWDLEEMTITEFESIFSLLASKRDNWTIDNGQILFANNSDLESFNSYLYAVQEHVQMQEGIQRQSIEKTNNNFEQLKN